MKYVGRLNPSILCTVLCGFWGCTGQIDAPGTKIAGAVGGNAGGSLGDGGSSASTATQICKPGKSNAPRIRRLTREQIDLSVEDLLGKALAPADRPSKLLAPDEEVGGFASNIAVSIDTLVAERHQEIAEGVAARLDLTKVVTCAEPTSPDCAQKFIATFGKRAFRRPLSDEEQKRFVDFFDENLKVDGHDVTLRLLVSAMLQSPYFLYHHEFADGDDSKRLTPFESASRLSFFLWNRMPDDELLAAAESGALGSDDEIADQVDRMLKDSKSRASRQSFFRQWLGLDGIETLQKSSDVYPTYSRDLGLAMQNESEAFVDHLMGAGDGRVATLLTGTFGFPDQALLKHYGVDAPAGWTPGDRVDFAPQKGGKSQRVGLLTQGAFLALHAHPDQTSPVRRGVIVRERLLCQELPDPPANVDSTPPAPKPDASTRERFLQHSEDANCKGCHSLIDPVGLAFENYDGIGAYREMEAGVKVDARGEIIAGEDAAGTFDGAAAMMNKLAGSQEVQRCVASQWFRFSLGRNENDGDTCALEALDEAFSQSKGDMRVLIKKMALSPSFLYLTTPKDQI